MVDYNNQTTISTPPGDVLKIAILERRAYFINAVEAYKKIDARSGNQGHGELYVVQAALYGLFWELAAPLKNDYSNEDFQKIWLSVEGVNTLEEALAVFAVLNDYLYKKNLTKFDTRKDVDNDDVEANNLSHGL